MTRSIASGAVALLILGGAVGAEAAPASAAAKIAATKVAEATPPIRAVAAIERDDEGSCSRARRRLWIAGEGWVVRRITTCR